MKVKAGWATPMLHVREIERSLAFYESLGFETIDTDGCAPIGWARAHCEGGALMFLRAEDPSPGSNPHPMLIVMYTADLPALREQLQAEGLDVRAIDYPEYMPSGKMNLRDPDGNILEICHWSDKEHSAWLKRLEDAKNKDLPRS